MTENCRVACDCGINGVHSINFAYTHNEKSCSVTIYKTLRYEGVQIIDCINYRRNLLTFLMFRVMYKTQVNDKEQQETTANLLKKEPKSAMI